MLFNNVVKIQVHTAKKKAISTDKSWYGSNDLILNMSILLQYFILTTHVKHK